MAIRIRQGRESELDPEKAVVGEWLLSTDTRFVRICVAPGILLRMATYESFETDMVKIEDILTETKTIQEAVKKIQNEVNSKAVVIENYTNQASSYAAQARQFVEDAKGYVGDAHEEAERAKLYADNASAVTGIEIAKKDRAGIIKGGENHIGEDGELILTKRTTTPTLYNSHAGGIKLNGLGGVSEQDGTSGAQLFDVSGYTGTGASVDKEGWITVTYDNTDGSSIKYIAVDVPVSDLLEVNTAYSVVAEIESLSNMTIQVVSGTADNSTGQFSSGSSFSVGGTRIVTPTTRETFENCATMLRTRCTISAGTIGSAKFRISVLADTTVTTDTFVYEKFTGGQPSPNPNYPQEIKPVTGKNHLDCRGMIENTILNITNAPIYDAHGNLKYLIVNGTASGIYGLAIGESVSLKKGESVILSGCPIGGSAGTASPTYRMQLREIVDGVPGDYIGGADIGNGVTYTATADITVKAYIRISSGVNCDNLKFYPMIRPASIADPTYVPYGLLRIWGHGKNFINAKLGVEIGDNNAYNLRNLEVGKTYTISLKQECTVLGNGKAQHHIDFFDASGNKISGKSFCVFIFSSVGDVKEGTYIFTVPEGTERVRFDLGTYYAESETRIKTLECQVEEGTEATPYAPYTSQSIILSQPIELNGFNGVADELVSGTKRFATAVFDGSDDEGWKDRTESYTNKQGNQRRYSISLDNSFNFGSSILCNIGYKGKILGVARYSDNGLSVFESDTDNILYVTLENDSIVDLATFNSWLAENPITVVYERANPVIEPLPTADQIALHSLMSYDGVTYLYCDSEIQPTWDLEYGTSKVGAYTLDAWNTTKRSEIKQEARYNEVVSTLLTLNQE